MYYPLSVSERNYKIRNRERKESISITIIRYNPKLYYLKLNRFFQYSYTQNLMIRTVRTVNRKF